MNLFNVFETGNWVLIITFLLLVFMSVFSWYIIILKALKFAMEKKAIGEFVKSRKLVKDSAIASLVKERTQVNFDKIKMKQDEYLTFLATISSTAPFVGLFGTVWGIYGALISIANLGSAGLEVVAGPMGEALVATAVGLFVAIPASFSYNIFVRLNKRLMQELSYELKDNGI